MQTHKEKMEKQKSGMENESSCYKQALALQTLLGPFRWKYASLKFHFRILRVALN